MARGVSASKEDVHQAIKNIDKGLFPKAFCKVVPDFLGNDPLWCNVMHADGAGTKSSLAYACLLYTSSMVPISHCGVAEVSEQEDVRK